MNFKPHNAELWQELTRRSFAHKQRNVRLKKHNTDNLVRIDIKKSK